MLNPEIKNTINQFFISSRAKRQEMLMSNITEATNDLAKRGMLSSSVAVNNISQVYKDEVKSRFEDAWESIKKTLEKKKITFTKNEAKEAEQLLKQLVNNEIDHLSTRIDTRFRRKEGPLDFNNSILIAIASSRNSIFPVISADLNFFISVEDAEKENDSESQTRINESVSQEVEEIDKEKNKRISRLIDRLSERPLSASMAQARKLAVQLGEAEFDRWLRLELYGYYNTNPALREEDVVPEYRGIAGQLTDEYGNTLVMSDPKAQFLNEDRLRFGVEELEQLQRKTTQLSYRDPHRAELIKKYLDVDITRFSFNPTQVAGILANIRGELQDRLMALGSSISLATDQQATDISETDEPILELKPNFYGLGVNLPALWRRLKAKFSMSKSA